MFAFLAILILTKGEAKRKQKRQLFLFARKTYTSEVEYLSTQEKYFSPFPSTLRKLIDEHHTTMTELARTLGLSRQAVGQYADGSTQPNAEKLCAIADYFGVSTDFLLGRTDARTTDTSLRAVCDFVGLSEQAVDYLHREAQTNSMTWNSDMLSYLLTNVDFLHLIELLTAHASAEDKAIEIPICEREIALMSKRDLFIGKLNELFSKIIMEDRNAFAGRSDFRYLYKTYFDIFNSPDFTEKGYTLDSIKAEFEENELPFDKKLFGKGGNDNGKHYEKC